MTLDEYKQWFVNEMSRMPVRGIRFEMTSYFKKYER